MKRTKLTTPPASPIGQRYNGNGGYNRKSETSDKDFKAPITKRTFQKRDYAGKNAGRKT